MPSRSRAEDVGVLAEVPPSGILLRTPMGGSAPQRVKRGCMTITQFEKFLDDATRAGGSCIRLREGTRWTSTKYIALTTSLRGFFAPSRILTLMNRLAAGHNSYQVCVGANQ
jgi:hypothetical protein